MIVSATSLSLHRDCPRCFWLHVNEGLKRPRAPFPSLPSGIDALLKAEADARRPELPAGLEVENGTLFADQAAIDRWRNFKQGLRAEVAGVRVMGCIDDLLWTPEGGVVLDFKTCGHQPGDGARYYQTQLDLYSLLLEENKIPTAGWGCLLYWYPVGVGNEAIWFRTQDQWLETSPQRALEQVKAAAQCASDPIPAGRCPWCEYAAAAAD